MDRIAVSDLSELIAAPFLGDEEFLAEDSLEEVVMLRNVSNEVDLIAGQIPVCSRYQRLKMPLWLGSHLQKRKMCHMDPPSWLNEAWVRAKLAEERNPATEGLAELPDHFMELAALLLRDSNDEQLRVAIEDLIAVRRTKILEGLKDHLDASTLVVNVTNFTAMERALLRPGATALLNKLQKLFSERTVASHAG